MTIKIKQFANAADDKAINRFQHILFVMPSTRPTNMPFSQILDQKLKRNDMKFSELSKTPLSSDLPNGGIASWVVLETKFNSFQRHTLLRKAVKPLIDEKPQEMAVVVYGGDKVRHDAATDSVYVTLLNAVELPERKGLESKKKKKLRPLETLSIFGCKEPGGFKDILSIVSGNTLTRQLTMLPPNELTPLHFRELIQKLAKDHEWKYQEFDIKKLKKIGAGAFLAVSQGSDAEDAAIVHLKYEPKEHLKHISLVGKGICFDTGGHNLKPARYMNGMHEDMNGSAVVLGILLAATKAQLPIKIDCWLAIAQNHIGPKAYKQNDVVTSLNGTTIEIVHTDAEGRMVLADTLTMASREQPDFMMDFATLTGSMVGALGNRYSGVLGNDPEILSKAVYAGIASGERVSVFPFDEDYEEELESGIADIKQCTLESEADHILAARFLYRFIENKQHVDWLHVDLSSYNRKGGLGAVNSDLNGFGVSFGINLIKKITNL